MAGPGRGKKKYGTGMSIKKQSGTQKKKGTYKSGMAKTKPPKGWRKDARTKKKIEKLTKNTNPPSVTGTLKKKPSVPSTGLTIRSSSSSRKTTPKKKSTTVKKRKTTTRRKK